MSSEVAKRTFEVYVDGHYVQTLYTGWTIRRLMVQLVRKYPDSDIDIFPPKRLVAVGTHKS